MTRPDHETTLPRRGHAMQAHPHNPGRAGSGRARDVELLVRLTMAAAPGAALVVGPSLPPWAFMWLLASSIYLSCKGLTWWQTFCRRQHTSTMRSLSYLLLWPGMDAPAFLDETRQVRKPEAGQWLKGAGNVVFGGVLLWGMCRLVWPISPILTGWIGMVGIMLMLHFGLFELLAVLWQSAGIDARPIMCRPTRGASLGDFWSKRWNLAFRTLTHRYVFRPLRVPLGAAGATMVVFLLSGLVHDLVISLPTGAGFGLPTAYFLIQGVGVLVEHSPVGRRLKLRRGMTGRIYAIAFTIVPLGMLLHEPFVMRVICPFLAVIGAV